MMPRGLGYPEGKFDGSAAEPEYYLRFEFVRFQGRLVTDELAAVCIVGMQDERFRRVGCEFPNFVSMRF